MFSNKEQCFVKYSKKIFSSVLVKIQGSNAMIDVLELYILINLFQPDSSTGSAISKTQHICPVFLSRALDLHLAIRLPRQLRVKIPEKRTQKCHHFSRCLYVYYISFIW